MSIESVRKVAIGIGVMCLGLVAGATPQVNTTNEVAWNQGLATWRLAGRSQHNAACATCHSPDAIDLAAFDFSDSDILRRAEAHLSPDDSARIVDFIHLVRQKYVFHKLLDPITTRPFQPTGSVLPGSTPALRDEAFGQELSKQFPFLFGPPIASIDQARKAEKQILDVDPWKLEYGIPFDRLSEDVAHGASHATIAQWLPEEPVFPKSTADWYQAEDDYLANPTDAALHQLQMTHLRLTFSGRETPMDQIAEAKFRAVLVLQHRLRSVGVLTGHTGPIPAAEIVPPQPANPLWNVGEAARDAAGRDAASIGMDPAIVESKSQGPPLEAQLSDLRLSWFWLGWLFDQGLYISSLDRMVREGEWMDQALDAAGPYPMHTVYWQARQQAIVSEKLGYWFGPLNRRHREWEFGALRARSRLTRLTPPSGAYRDAYLRLTANCIRMNLYLLQDELNTTHEVWMRRNAQEIVRVFGSFLNSAQPANAKADQGLVAQLEATITLARERL